VVGGQKFCGGNTTCAIEYNIMERRIWNSLFPLKQKQQLIQKLKREGKSFKFPTEEEKK